MSLATCRFSPNVSSWQERFSDAQFLAVAADACCELQAHRPDLNKIDWSMSHEKIDIGVFWQLKTLTDAKPSNGVYSYQIDRNLYDRHRKKDNTLRLIALLALPSKDAPWLEQTHEGMTIRRCLYWACLRGAPTVKAKGTGPVTIKFPTNQVLTPSVLLRIYEGLAIDEPLEEVIACCQKMNSSL